MLPWFKDDNFPLYLAPMAGVTDVTFRELTKELGADVTVTEFVSAEGIIQRDDRTKKYTEFSDQQRPTGVQLFGSDGERMGEAAKKIIDWKQPDFIDINFGCPVKKVVSKNGGSSLLKDCPVLASVARGIHKAVGDQVPVTAKIRVGWDEQTINALEVTHILEEEGMQAIAIHGRTRSQGYTGVANWEIIDECARARNVPIIGNGDITTVQDIAKRKNETQVAGLMIGRAAMEHPWIFQEAKAYLEKGIIPEPVSLKTRWEFMLRHCEMALNSNRYGDELQTMRKMRGRLMSYCKGFPKSKHLRQILCKVETLEEVKTIAQNFI